MKKLLITIAGSIALFLTSDAQSNRNSSVVKDGAFYYYHNEKVMLKPVHDVLFVSFEDDNKFEKAKQLPSNYKSELLKTDERADFHKPVNAIRFKVNKANFSSESKVSEFAETLKSRNDVVSVYPAYVHGSDTVYVCDIIMFELNNEADRRMIEEKLKLSKGAITKTFNMGDHNQYIAHVGKDFNVFDVTNSLVESGQVKFAHPNFTFTAHSEYTPNDSYYSSQWFLNQPNDADIDAPTAWNITKGNPNVIIAVMDGHGFDLSHPDMAGKYIYPYDPAHGNYNPVPENQYANHGTPCAGLIAAATNNASGVASIGFNVKVMPICIGYNAQSNGVFTTTDAIIANAANHIINNGQVYAVSNSYSSAALTASIESSFNSISTNARGGKGAVVFASTGNDNNGSAVTFPAAYASVVGVGASDGTDHRASFSNYGGIVDIVAPGVNCYAIDRIGSDGYNTTGDYYANFSGTSAACPIATAIVGLIASVNPNLNSNEYKNMMFQSCEKVGGYTYGNDINHLAGTWNNEMGYGRVNAYNAIMKLNLLTTNYTAQTFCSTPQSISIPVFTSPYITFNPSNIFTAQLSDSNGSFANPIDIGTLVSTSSGYISATIPAAMPVGNGYRIRIKSSSPQIISDPGSKIGIEKEFADAWVPLSNFGGIPRTDATSFVINGYAYVGLGVNGTTNLGDFRQYDPVSDSWSLVANFPGAPRNYAVSFVIDGIAYVGTGHTGTSLTNDFYSYDPATDTWDTVSSVFPGLPRFAATAFSAGGYGYVGMGYASDGHWHSEIYKFDPATGWDSIPITNYPGGTRTSAFGFGIGSKAYVGGGSSQGGTFFNDFYEFNTTNNTWTAKQSIPVESGWDNTDGFVINNKLFVATGYNPTGYKNAFYEYNPATDKWTAKPNFIGSSRTGTIGFSINGKGYLGLGFESNGTHKNDFYEYTPNNSIVTGIISPLSICAGGNEAFGVPFTIGGSFGACSANTFTAQLSNANGSFASPVTIGTLTGSSEGTIACIIPDSIPAGSKYRIRVVSSNPSVTGTNNGSNIKILKAPARPGVISGPTSVCLNSIKAYSIGTVASATSYTWAVPAGSIILTGQGTKNVTVQWNVAGKLKVKANGICGSSTFRSLNVGINCREGEENFFDASINSEVFPNPTNGSATLRFSSSKNDSYEIKITDISGKQILVLKGNAIEGINELPIDLSKYEKGVYFINIITSEEVQTKKLIKE